MTAVGPERGGNSAPPKRRQRHPHLLVAGAWIAFGTFAVWFAARLIPNLALHLQFEDQMIVLRYARNLVEGNGLVYNPGERVMGFTTPLFTLLSSVFVLLAGDQAALWQNVFGVLCMLGTAAVAAWLLVRLGAGAAAPLAVALITFNAPTSTFNYLFVTMEVHLFALLFVLTVALYVDKRHTAATVASALLFLTRPEGVLLTVCLLGDKWARDRRLPVRQAAAALLTVAPWLLFATVYYGSPFTATLAAKSGGSHLFDGFFAYLRHVAGVYNDAASSLLTAYVPASNTEWFTAASLLLGVSLPLGALTIVRRDSRAWPIIGFPALVLCGFAAIGAWPMFTWHYYPLSTAGAITLAFGAHAVLEWCLQWDTRKENVGADQATRQPAARPPVWGGLTLLALAVPVLNDTRGQIDYAFGDVVNEKTHSLEALGRELAARFDEDTSVLVDEIGFIGWHSRLRIIDQAGLVTPGLRYDVTREDAVKRHEPDLMLLHVEAPERHGGRNGEGFPFGYELVEEFDFFDSWRYRLYKRPGFPFTSPAAPPR